MPLLLPQLLDDADLGLTLVAGHAGLTRRGPVRWAHISEIPDPTPWLEGGEVLLTTGLGVRDDAALQRRLIAGLDERGCTGVGFGVGVVLDAVPGAMLAEAQARALPLFTVPYEVPFIAVTKRVSRAVFEEHYATLRGAIDLHRSVLGAVLAGAGIRGVLATVAARMPDTACVLFDYYGAVMASRGSAGGALTTDPGRLWRALDPHHRSRDRFEVRLDDQTVVGSLVRAGDEVEAVLAVVGLRPLAEHECLLLEQGLAGISLELARGQSVRESRRSRVDDLLEEVAEGRIVHRALVRRLLRLRIDVDSPFQVLCLRLDRTHGAPGPRVSQRALSTLAEDALAGAGATPVLGRFDGAVYCICQPAGGDHAQRIAGAIQARGWRGVCIGRSRAHTGGDALETAVREARVAAHRITRPPAAAEPAIVDVLEIGLAGLLAGLDDNLGARAFVSAVLGPVLEHDRREGSALVSTLRAWVASGCRPGTAAAQLGVHRHTLVYRLDRIRQLTGRDPRDGHRLLELGLALELLARDEPTAAPVAAIGDPPTASAS